MTRTSSELRRADDAVGQYGRMASRSEKDRSELIEAGLRLPGVAEATKIYRDAAERAHLPTTTVTTFAFATDANASIGVAK